MNAGSEAARCGRYLKILLVLVALFSLVLGTQGCGIVTQEIRGDFTFDFNVAVAPGYCTPFDVPALAEISADRDHIESGDFTLLERAVNRYSVIGDELSRFQFCVAADAPDIVESVDYMLIIGPRFGRGTIHVTVRSLGVTVSAAPDPVSVGSELTYTITLTNLSATRISGLSFVDTLPASVTFVSGPQFPCDQPGDTFKCIDIEIGGGASVTYQFVVIPTTPGTITNTLLVPGRLTITTTTTVNVAGADLLVTIADSPDPVAVGGQLTYNIIVRNNGPSDATDGVTLTDTLPPELNFVSATSSRATCTYFESSRQVACEIDTLEAGRDFEIALITALTFPPAEGQAKNAASVSLMVSPDAINYDPNPDNNAATATTTVNLPSGADLAVIKTGSPNTVIRGNSLTYTITVTNNGPSAATGVKLTDSLPPFELDSSTIVVSQGSFTRTNRPFAITCDFGTLASGASATLTFTGFTGPAGTITNTAIVTANEADPDTSNNTATVSTTVNPP